MTLEELRKRRAELAQIVAQLGGVANRTEKQNQEFDGATAEFGSVDTEIGRQENLERINARMAAPAVPVVQRSEVRPAAPGPSASIYERLDRLVASMPYGPHRMQAVAADVFQESAPADGGYLLPVDRRELLRLLMSPATVHGLCDTLTTPSNAIELPVDSDPVWSAELAAADVGENVDLVEDKLAFTEFTATLTKSGVLVRVTREMLEDTTGIAQWVLTKLGEKLAWKQHAKAVAAFLASGGKVTVAKTAAAAAGSPPDLANIQKIWASMLPEHRTAAVWIANPAIEPTLQNFVIGNCPVYLPPTGIEGQPFGRLFGRPVFFTEGLPAVGTTGDIGLVAPQTFFGVYKAQGPRLEESIHAEFKRDVVQYRGYLRSVFKSKFATQLARADGTVAGNYVTLATR
jgi:HK97 family phage major capsid protein